MPLSRNSLLRAIRQKVPPLLASASPFFIPPTMYYDSQVRVQVVLWNARLYIVREPLDGTEVIGAVVWQCYVGCTRLPVTLFSAVASVHSA
jgi:hypothetical protein